MNSPLRSKIALLSVFIVLASASNLLRAADPTGRWKSEFETQAGQMKYTYDLKTDGDKVTGQAIRDRDGEIVTNAITDGKTTNDDISFVETAKIQDQDIRIEYSGKIAGTEMKLTRKVGDFGTSDIVAHLETNAATTASIDGNWQSEFDSGVGHQKYSYTFKVADGKVTGQAIRDLNDEKTTNTITGKVTGTDLTFTEPLKVADAEIDIEYSGKIDGDKLELTRKVGDYGTTDITVTRAKDPAPK
jgi:hypothetical protein